MILNTSAKQIQNDKLFIPLIFMKWINIIEQSKIVYMINKDGQRERYFSGRLRF